MTGLTDILGGLLSPVKDIIGEVVVDPNKRDQINLQLAQLEDQAVARLDALNADQTEVNKVEASSGSLFVAGWRPAVGWVGATGLLYSTLVEPLASWVARLLGYLGPFPVIDNQLLLYILGGMLGLGTMRTVEKISGVSTNNLTDVPGRTVPATTTSVEVSTAGQVSVNKTATSATTAPKKKGFHIKGIF